MSRTITVLSTAYAVLLAISSSIAGPLNPPAGAVNATMKSLAEVEPRTAINSTNTPGDANSVYRISQPGSYYLTGNVTVGTGKSGIEVASSNVTVDLNGYTITGQPGSVHGVATDSTLTPYKHIRVSNGIITSMDSSGVYLVSFSPGQAQQHAVELVDISACTNSGIYVNDARITECRVHGCGAIGIYTFAPFDSTVDRCSAGGCGTTGVRVVQGTVSNTTASNNTTRIYVDQGCVTSCAARNNATGIVLGFGVASGCACEGNTSVGIDLLGNSLATGNTVGSASIAVAGTVGIRSSANSGARIEGNNLLRMGTGIAASSTNNLIIGNSFRACTAALNTAAGNRVGTLVTGTSSAAINGNAGGGLGTTDPFANIVY